MERLVPFERLDDDYYLGEVLREGGESDDDASSDDEVQRELKKIAGIPTCVDNPMIKERSDFENDMENELDVSITDYAEKHMGSNEIMGKVTEMDLDDGPPPLEPNSSDDEVDREMDSFKKGDLNRKALPPPPAKSSLKKVSSSSEPVPGCSKTDRTPLVSPLKRKQVSIKEDKDTESMDTDSAKNDVHMDDGEEEKEKKKKMEKEEEEEEDDNPIKKMAKERKKQAEEPPEFYDADEDDENERWIAEQRRVRKGGKDGEKSGMEGMDEKQRRSKIDDGSDAVLSCPGCMSLLTRDCQRHELYRDQYRAMFVENVVIDEEVMTVEKSGKEKRKEKQKARKRGDEPNVTTSDIFYPVKCSVCSTSVAVVDLDEVYHFFNVLAGYA